MSALDFVVVDVETANSDIESICQIGIVVFEKGRIVDEWVTLVNPESYFDDFNIEIHGITPNDVKNSPTIQELKPVLQSYFSKGLVASYGSFDRTSFRRNFNDFDYQWLDIMKVVRRTWKQVSYSGYGLFDVCDFLEINLMKHHDALCDARAAGEVLLKALSILQIDLKEIISRSNLPISDLRALKRSGEVLDGGNPDGKWFGEVLVFTGELSMPRSEASILASHHGFDVARGVTKKTTFLVKGVQDAVKLHGAEMSKKELNALTHIKKGRNIVFLTEKDFFEIIKDESN